MTEETGLIATWGPLPTGQADCPTWVKSPEVENQRCCVALAVRELAQCSKPTGRRNCLPVAHRSRDAPCVSGTGLHQSFPTGENKSGHPSTIARRCELTPSRVGEVIAGRRQLLHMDVVERIADGLRIRGHMPGLARRSWETPQALVVTEREAPQEPEPEKQAPASPTGLDVDSISVHPERLVRNRGHAGALHRLDLLRRPPGQPGRAYFTVGHVRLPGLLYLVLVQQLLGLPRVWRCSPGLCHPPEGGEWLKFNQL